MTLSLQTCQLLVEKGVKIDTQNYWGKNFDSTDGWGIWSDGELYGEHYDAGSFDIATMERLYPECEWKPAPAFLSEFIDLFKNLGTKQGLKFAEEFSQFTELAFKEGMPEAEKYLVKLLKN